MSRRCGLDYGSERRRSSNIVVLLAIVAMVVVMVVMWVVPFAACIYYNLFPAFDYEDDIRGHVEVYGTRIAGVDHDLRILYVEPADTYTVVYALKPPVRGFYTILVTGKESDVYAYVQDRLCGVSDVVVKEGEVAVKVIKVSRECNATTTVQLDIKASLAREWVFPAVIGEYSIRDTLAVVELPSNASTKHAGTVVKPVSVEYNSSQMLLAYTVPLIFIAVATSVLVGVWRLGRELEEFTWGGPATSREQA